MEDLQGKGNRKQKTGNTQYFLYFQIWKLIICNVYRPQKNVNIKIYKKIFTGKWHYKEAEKNKHIKTLQQLIITIYLHLNKIYSCFFTLYVTVYHPVIERYISLSVTLKASLMNVYLLPHIWQWPYEGKFYSCTASSKGSKWGYSENHLGKAILKCTHSMFLERNKIYPFIIPFPLLLELCNYILLLHSLKNLPEAFKTLL